MEVKMMDIGAILRSDMFEQQAVTLTPEMQITRLRDHFSDFQRRHTFEPGDIVTIKPGLGVFKHPGAGQPCIVLERLKTPLLSNESGSPEEGAAKDLRVAMLTPHGTIAIFLFESAWFQPYQEAAE